MKFNKYTIIAGAFSVYACSVFAMDTHSMEIYQKRYGTQTVPYTKLKPDMIEERVNFLIEGPLTDEKEAEINKLIEKGLAPQAPSRADRLRERLNAKRQLQQLSPKKPELKRPTYGTIERRTAVEAYDVDYPKFKEKIKNITDALADTIIYLNNQKVTTEIVEKLAGPINGGITQKTKNIQNYLNNKRKEITSIQAPWTERDFNFYLHRPESASEKAYFKDALKDLYNKLDSIVASVYTITKNNPVGSSNNALLIQDFVIDDAGLIEHMTFLLNLGAKFGVLSPQEIKDHEKKLLDYIANITAEISPRMPVKAKQF